MNRRTITCLSGLAVVVALGITSSAVSAAGTPTSPSNYFQRLTDQQENQVLQRDQAIFDSRMLECSKVPVFRSEGDHLRARCYATIPVTPGQPQPGTR